MPALPAQYVEVPPAPQRRFGLLSVVTLVDSSQAHWRDGISWTSPACSTVRVASDPCETPVAKTPDPVAPYSEASPMVLYAMPECAPFGVDLQKAAMDALAYGEEAGLAKGLAQRMAADTDVASAGAATTPGMALATMEGAIAEAGIAGVIGIDVRVASLLSDRLEQHGTQLTTKLGTPIWPFFDVAGSAWMYATGRILVYRGTASVFGPVQKLPEANVYTALAERPYVVGYECPLAKIGVTLTDCCAA